MERKTIGMDEGEELEKVSGREAPIHLTARFNRWTMVVYNKMLQSSTTPGKGVQKDEGVSRFLEGVGGY